MFISTHGFHGLHKPAAQFPPFGAGAPSDAAQLRLGELIRSAIPKAGDPRCGEGKGHKWSVGRWRIAAGSEARAPVPIAPPVRATRPRPPGVLVPASPRNLPAQHGNTARV